MSIDIVNPPDQCMLSPQDYLKTRPVKRMTRMFEREHSCADGQRAFRKNAPGSNLSNKAGSKQTF